MDFGKELFENSLKIKKPFFIDKITIDEKSKKIDVYIKFKKGHKFKYFLDKRKKLTAYDTVSRTWQHLNILEYKSFIHSKVPRIRCGDKIQNVSLTWANKNSDITLDLENQINEFGQILAIKHVGDLYGMHDTKVWRIINNYTTRKIKELNLSTVKRIGVDETSRKKGHVYLTVFIDLKSFWSHIKEKHQILLMCL